MDCETTGQRPCLTLLVQSLLGPIGLFGAATGAGLRSIRSACRVAHRPGDPSSALAFVVRVPVR